MLEKTLESPLDCKEIQPVHPKGNQFSVFIGRTDAETEIPIFWPPDEKNWFIWKDPDAEKNWRQEKGTTEDEMASLTRWTWVWASSRSWWWTGKPGMLQSMGSQRVRHDWATELNWGIIEWQLRRSLLAELETGNSTYNILIAISGTGEPGGLPSMGSHKVGHNWSDLAVTAVSA